MSIDTRIADAFEKALDSRISKKTRPKETMRFATVTRVDEDGQVWAHLDGGVIETPIFSSSVNFSKSDRVEVSVTGNKAYIRGNVSDQSTNVATVNEIIGNIKNSSVIQESSGSPSGSTDDYNSLSNKPSIEGVTLIGNKVFPQFGLHVDSELDPATGGPQSDEKYALTTLEINDLWNLA